MAVKYDIIRLEAGKDSAGEDEVFMVLDIDDDGDCYTFPIWLSKKDVAEYLNDKLTIHQIAERLLPKAKQFFEDTKKDKIIETLTSEKLILESQKVADTAEIQRLQKRIDELEKPKDEG